MSREVDQRVVELQFNNANFEKNTKKSMDSIDRMMEKLQFKGAEKGFEKLDAAAEKVDFATMNRSLDTLQQKFSALDIMAATVLVNITSKAMNAGERLVKSLSLDQITSGWNKYAEKTSNVQTIMNATGKSIDQVNGYLNKLMWYSDETSYSFSEMTSALSQMTAAGGNIDKMIPMIMGIANATADAGKTGFAFQSTIRNLTQSYSAGHLQLQDWKSLNLMGTATKALKQELIDTAEELGVIKKGEVTIASFESSLQKKWANMEVMEKTFGKYASMMEAAYELTQKNKGMTSSEALEQLKGQYGELAERAALAAQQATSFAQAIDSTKDAVSSKWMAVFETLFGNKEEATDTWTELANRLYDIFVPSIDALNDRMKAGLDTGWQQMLSNELGDQGNAYTYALEQVALATGALTEKQIEEAGSFGAALQENGVSADTLRQALDEARTSTEKLLALSDKELDAQGYDKDAIQKAHDQFVKLNEAVQNGTLDLEGYAEAIGRVSGREHLIQGLWNIMDAIGKLVTPIKEAFNEIFPPADGDRIYTIAERFDLLTQKLIISDKTAANIKKTFEGVFSVIRVGVNMMKTVVQTAANVLSAAVPLGDVLLGMTASIGGFVSSVDESLDPLEALGSMITGFVQTIAPVLYSFGKEADVVFSNFANGAKDAFNSFDPERMKDFITGGLSVGILASVKSFLDGIKSVGESAKGIIGGIKDTIDSLGEAIDAWKEAKKSETLITIAKSIGIIAASLAVVSMIKPERLSASMEAMTGVFLGLLGVMKALALISKDVSSLKLMAVSTGMMAVSSAVLVLSGALKVISTIDKSNLLASVAALGGVMAGLTIVGAVLSKDGVKFGIGNGAAFLMLAGSMNLLVSAFKSFGEMNWTEIGKALTTAGVSIGVFVLALNLAKGTLGAAVALTTMAAAVNLLVPAIKELGSLSLTEMGMALLAVAGAFTALGVAAVILAPLTPVIVALSLSISALALSIGALLALNSAAMFIGNLASSLTLLQNLNFQVFIEALKSAAWLVVEFITGIIKGLAEVASTLATSIAKIIEAVCSAIVLSAPAIGEALYAAGTTLIDVIIKLLDYIWVKCEPALNDLWDKFTGLVKKKAENFSLLDLLGLKWENPFAPFLDELEHGDSFMAGLYQQMTGTGKYATEGFANGETDKDAIAQVKQASSNVANTAVETMKDDLDQHSPSKVMAEIGRFVTLGLAEGIGDQNALAKAKAAMLNVATGIRTVFTNFWGIHSPSDLAMSDAENILEGAVLGMCDPEARQKLYDESYNAASEVKGGVGKALDEAATLVQDKMQGIYAAFKMDPLGSGSNPLRNGVETARKQFETAIQDSTLIPGKNGIQTANTDTTRGVNDIAAAAKSRLAGYFGAFGDYYKKAVDDITPGTTDPTTKTKASKTGKSLAETLAEEYSKKLKANKYLQDALSKETALWELQSEHSVTNEELLAKRTEVVTKQIELQADRVAIAQQQYDTMLARVGAGNDKTKDAYNTLLDEKANLEKLRQSRHSDIWGDVLSRYENDAKTAEDEYDLWVSMYEDTATVAERSNRQMMQINKKIDAQAKVVTAAEEEYTKLKEEFGEQSQQTQVAYRKYLEEQKEQQELINELEKAQLTQFANQITRYEKEGKIVSNRQRMLEKLYDDGSLSERESAYEQAVEKYGEGSKEARRAAMQGTMSSLMGVGAAMRNMSTSLKKLTEYQKTYDFYVAQGKKDSEEALDALAELQDEQYNFVGFAESLASAFDMSENGKQAMMQLGYTISKNWKPIYNGFNQVWKKINPAFAESLTNLIGLYSREGASETMAATMNAVVSAMRGDWGSAVASGLTAVLDIVGTDFGRTLSKAIGNALRSAFSGNGLFAQLLSKLLGGMNPGGSGGGGFFSKALDFIKRLLGRKSTGVAGGGSGISKWLSAGKSVLGLGKAAKVATDLVPVLHSAGAATANVASGVATVAKAAGAAKVAATAAGAATSGTLAKVGMGVAKVAASLGPHGLLVGACVAGAALVGTAVVKNWDKVKAGIGKAWDWIKEKASNLWSGAKGLVGSAINIGKNVVGGLWNGIKGVAGGLWNGIKGIGRGIINGFKSIFGIHSPSTVFAGIGGYLMEGLANGITNTADGVDQSLEAVADGALDIAQSSAMRLLDVLNDESDPSIQPVVDLTNAENALDWMDSRLAGDRAVTLSATRSVNLAGTVNQNANRQNGKADPNDPEALSASGNRDVVDAIQSMGERIDGVARAVASMKVVMNSRKLVGEIKSDMNTALGELAERGR